MNYKTSELLRTLRYLMELIYDTGWLAGVLSGGGGTDLSLGVQQMKIDRRDELMVYVETQIKEMGEALEEVTK